MASHSQDGEAALSNSEKSLCVVDAVAFCFCRKFRDFHALLKLDCTLRRSEGDAQFAGKAGRGDEWIGR